MMRRSSSRIVLTAIGVALVNATVHACPICFQVEESATTDGVLAAVTVLAGITAGVLLVCGTFVIGFLRRDGSRHAEARRDAEAPTGAREIG